MERSGEAERTGDDHLERAVRHPDQGGHGGGNHGMTGTYIWLDEDGTGSLYITIKLDPECRKEAERLQRELRDRRVELTVTEVVGK